MNCQEILERVEAIVTHPLSETEKRSCEEHLTGCDECQSALHGTEALRLIRNQREMVPPNGLFEKVLSQTTGTKQQLEQKNRFWLGAGFGGAVAATIVAGFIMFGVPSKSPTVQPLAAEFMISMHETRDLNIAIDTGHPIPGARVSIMLSGGVELAGYGNQRELTWTNDLAAGVNKLTLPLIALDQSGGQLIVKLDYGDSHQVFFVSLKLES